MKHIGVSGTTIPGALLCIEAILEESYHRFGGKSLIHPRITYTTAPLNEINPAIHTGILSKICYNAFMILKITVQQQQIFS